MVLNPAMLGRSSDVNVLLVTQLILISVFLASLYILTSCQVNACAESGLYSRLNKNKSRYSNVPSTQEVEVEAAGSRVQSHLGTQNEFQATLG